MAYSLNKTIQSTDKTPSVHSIGSTNFKIEHEREIMADETRTEHDRTRTTGKRRSDQSLRYCSEWSGMGFREVAVGDAGFGEAFEGNEGNGSNSRD